MNLGCDLEIFINTPISGHDVTEVENSILGFTELHAKVILNILERLYSFVVLRTSIADGLYTSRYSAVS